MEILALHGFTGSGADFEAIEPLLPFPLIHPDLPGHGTGAHLGCTLAGLDALLSAELRPARALLGYSMGARLALHLALLHPPRALILISGSPGLPTGGERAARRAADEALAQEALRLGPAFAARWAETPILASQAKIPAPWRERFLARRQSQDARGLAAALRGFGTGALPSLWERLPELRAPTLLLTGAEDAKFEAIADAMAARIPGAQRASIAGAGHTPHLEAPGPSAAVIRRFLEDVAARGPL